MKRKVRLLGVFLLITALIIVQIPVSKADASTTSDFKIDGKILVRYTGTERNISVPDGVETIGRDAFKDNSYVEKVTLSKSVSEIAPYAFWGCERLKEVLLGKGIDRIGDYAFANCRGLETMTVPAGVKTIGIYSFEDCINFTDITIPYTVTDIHETAFDGCRRLVIHCEEGSYASRYARAFYERQKEMAEYEDVAIYPGTSDSAADDTIGREPNAADGVELKEDDTVLGQVQIVQNSAVVFIDNSSFDVYEGEYNAPEEEKKDESAISELSLVKIGGVIPKCSIVDLRIVADQAYYKNDTLRAIHIPDSIEQIGEFAFARSSLKEVSVGAGTRTIGYGAFYHCDELRKVSLPEGLLCVEPKAFEHTAWVDDFLDRKDGGDSDFLISGGILVAYRGNSPAVDVPEGVRVIAAQCFKGHDEIGTVRLPKGLLCIGEEAFADCSKLSTLILGETERYIKDRAFAGTALLSVTLPKSIKEMGLDCFAASTRVTLEAEAKSKVENSARRLSNYEFRGTGELLEGSVEVAGMIGAKAKLSGAKDAYQLYVASAEPKLFETAFVRNLSDSVPENAIAYEFILTDKSGIAITKLGKQILSVALPVSGAWKNCRLVGVGMDANGQLDKLDLKKMLAEDTLYVVVPLHYVSQICIYPLAVEDDAAIQTLEEGFNQMTALYDNGKTEDAWRLYLKYGLASLSLLAGLLLVLAKGR